MTQEDKELLLKDLCARLPHKTIVECNDNDGSLPNIWEIIDINVATEDVYLLNTETAATKLISVEDIKPYLFPLSSMTEEQYENFIIRSGWDGDIEDIKRGKFSCIGYIGLDYIYDTIDWFNKNHFDYRGLIPMGLAIDATGLNIYS